MYRNLFTVVWEVWGRLSWGGWVPRSRRPSSGLTVAKSPVFCGLVISLPGAVKLD